MGGEGRGGVREWEERGGSEKCVGDRAMVCSERWREGTEGGAEGGAGQ